MHVWQWFFTGLAVGLCAHLVLSGSRFNLGGHLALGALGGLSAGVLLRVAGVVAAGSGLARSRARPVAAVSQPPDSAVDRTTLLQQAMTTGLSDVERSVLGKFLNRETVVRDIEREAQERKTFGERATDRIAGFGGSWAFLGLFGATLVAWMIYNVDTTQPFDPYPFILLNLALSCIAAVQAPIILMSQNRQNQKDRMNAAADYEVNMKAEMEILALHEKFDELREKSWRDLIAMQQRQLVLLQKLEAAAAR